LSSLQERLRQAESDQKDGASTLLHLAQELMLTSLDGRIKLYVTWRTLAYRRSQAELFRSGSYVPLLARGAKADYVCAFARRLGLLEVLAVVPCLVVGLTNDIERPPIGEDVWSDTWLPLPDVPAGTAYRNLFTGETLEVVQKNEQTGLRLAAMLGSFPIALLERAA
jgi:(1->4)-alpha-D-glucan 1-alpha-D-glucosylmutase